MHTGTHPVRYMSDRNALNLWKIPHFQDNMKNPRRLTGPMALLGLLLFGGGLWLWKHPEPLLRHAPGLARMLPGIGDRATQPASGPEDEETRLRAIAAGNQLVRQARLKLTQRQTSLTAQVLQIVQTRERTYRGTGRFVQSSLGKSLLEIETDIDGLIGSMKQVSNGQVIWQIQELRGEPRTSAEDSDQREELIDRIDLQRLQRFAEVHEVAPLDPRLAKETQGGLAGLLASLECLMDFRLLKKVRLADETLLVLQGDWKVTPYDRNYANQFVADVARAGSPDRVRLYLRERDLLPVRYVCLKRPRHSSSWIIPLAMELTDINPDAVIDPSLFNYRPTAEQVPNDITHQYLQRLETLFVPQTADAR